MFGAHSKAPLIRPLTLSIRVRVVSMELTHMQLARDYASRFWDFAIVSQEEQTEYVRVFIKNAFMKYFMQREYAQPKNYEKDKAGVRFIQLSLSNGMSIKNDS